MLYVISKLVIDKINIIGYGNQAKAWAQNLQDSGYKPRILLRDGSKSIPSAKSDGFTTETIQQALKQSQQNEIFCLLIPDDKHKDFFDAYAKYINETQIFVFAHGWSIDYAQNITHSNYALLAPKAIGTVVRANYLEKKSIIAGFFVSKKENKTLIGNLAKALGFTKLVDISPRQEVVSDLLTEQVLLCGGVPKLINETANLLIKNGIPKEIAVAETLFELKYILDTVIELGSFSKLYDKISPVALLGTYKNIKENDTIDKALKDILSKDFINYIADLDINSVRKKLKKDFTKFDTILKDL